MSDFAEILSWVLVHEGGYVNSKHDPGGATNRGVTQRVYDGYRAKSGLPKQGVKAITDDEVEAIYRRQYWDAVRGDDLPDGLNYAVFDFAVNSGPGRAAKFLQKRLDVPADGVIGNVTLGAVQRCANKSELIQGLCRDRLAWMKTLSTWKHFGRGWTRRVMGEIDGVQQDDHGVIDRAMKLYRGDDVAAPTKVEEGAGKAEQKDEKATKGLVESLKSPEGLATACSAGGGLLASLGQLPQVLQYAVAGVIVLAALTVAYLLVSRRRAEA